ncbi:putative lyase YjhH [Leminorella grimontii]|uniref:Lyase YjhH n=1 Tax=Leminorella grimontii TaxID=82981 RepID=A0AAV5MZW0_9GAMM|nr:dihydrodipicolinate synthase family protein [Leminorella grimontii]KFC96473.1 putative dihydrodipicolinate synthase [Leminorella grimontii ATCC 33999 = DSM 5078]GKX54329.1 putative lyase YjhH [Leminorella grimontii]GKX57761.1 putative lyase YjhH [Leminorella grimontii]VFS59527.1 Probable 2-keto-3-deoxy-galactonate aldolase YagE [Leminorella grimontii]
MADLSKFCGVYPPVPTVFHQDGRLDTVGMGKLIDKLVNEGVDGMLILGSGGEFCHMPKARRFEVAEFAVKHIAGRVPVLLGISSPSTEEVIEFGQHADALGVDAVLVLNPYYALLSEEFMYNHFSRVARAVKSPVILYNFPALTGQDISVGLIKRLAENEPNIIGIKDTVDNISHVREIINQVRPVRGDFVVFSGFDEYMMDTLIMGGNGGIPATANFASDITCGIYRAWKEKDYETMFNLQRRLSQLSTVYGLETPFFGVIKQAIRLSGLDISPEVLAPVERLSNEKTLKLVEVMERAGIKV